MSTDAAERIARELYGLDGSATRAARRARPQLPLRDAGDERFVLKLHAPRPDLALEDAVLEHLRDEPAGAAARGRDRRPRRPDGAAAHAGSTAGRGRTAGGDLASLGRTVARVDRALADFEHPAMRRPHRWDLRNAGEFGIAVPELDHLPHQVIHNDANEHNVLVAEDGTVAG